MSSDCWRLFAVAAFVSIPSHRVEGGEPAYTIEWTQQLHSVEEEYAGQIVVDATGAAHLCGHTYGALGGPNAGSRDAFVARLKPDGHVDWISQFGTFTGDDCSGVGLDMAGNVYSAGSTFGLLGASDPSPTWIDAFVAKHDAGGKNEWIQQIGSPQSTRCWGLSMSASNHLYFCGDVAGALGPVAFGSLDGFVVKMSLNGRVVWARQIGTPAWDNALSVAVDREENVFITGFTYGALAAANAGDQDVYLAKFNDRGDLLWQRQIGTPTVDIPNEVATDRDGNSYVTGETYGTIAGTNAGNVDAFVVKYAPDGTLLWARQFGSTTHDRGTSVAILDSGNVLVAGSTSGDMAAPNAGFGDPFLAMFDDAGMPLWAQQFGTTSNEIITSIDLGPDASLYITGTACVIVNEEVVDCDVFVAKLVPTAECAADVTGDQNVDAADLVQVLMHWGPCPPPPAACDADTNDDDVVNVNDLLDVLNNWGPC